MTITFHERKTVFQQPTIPGAATAATAPPSAALPPLNPDALSSAAIPAPPLSSGNIHNQASASARRVIFSPSIPGMIVYPDYCGKVTGGLFHGKFVLNQC